MELSCGKDGTTEFVRGRLLDERLLVLVDEDDGRLLELVLLVELLDLTCASRARVKV